MSIVNDFKAINDNVKKLNEQEPELMNGYDRTNYSPPINLPPSHGAPDGSLHCSAGKDGLNVWWVADSNVLGGWRLATEKELGISPTHPAVQGQIIIDPGHNHQNPNAQQANAAQQAILGTDVGGRLGFRIPPGYTRYWVVKSNRLWRKVGV